MRCVTDDISLVKVISYCTSRGKTIVRIVVETRQVNKETLSEFIDVEDAYSRMNVFVTTHRIENPVWICIAWPWASLAPGIILPHLLLHSFY